VLRRRLDGLRCKRPPTPCARQASHLMSLPPWEPFAVRMQARLELPRQTHHGRSSRRCPAVRSSGSFDRSACAVTVNALEDGLFHRESQQGGSDDHRRVHVERKGYACYRQNLQVVAHYHLERNHQGLYNRLISPESLVISQQGDVARHERLWRTTELLLPPSCLDGSVGRHRDNRRHGSEDRDVADHSRSIVDPTLLHSNANAFSSRCVSSFWVVRMFGQYAERYRRVLGMLSSREVRVLCPT
jgi:hypothetical protein